jgi:hypothetical protein
VAATLVARFGCGIWTLSNGAQRLLALRPVLVLVLFHGLLLLLSLLLFALVLVFLSTFISHGSTLSSCLWKQNRTQLYTSAAEYNSFGYQLLRPGDSRDTESINLTTATSAILDWQLGQLWPIV